MFDTGTYIICGQHGVCRVESIGPLKLTEASGGRDYYTLSLVYSKGGVVYVPADSNKIVMRPVLTKEEARQLIGEIKEMDMLRIASERQREDTFKKALRTCDVRDWVRVIKTIYVRKKQRLEQGKKVTASDERCLHAAEDNLYGELAVSLGVKKREVEDYIAGILDGNGAKEKVSAEAG